MDLILDTRSPIPLMPKNRRKKLQPQKITPTPKNEDFVDLNNNEVKINGT